MNRYKNVEENIIKKNSTINKIDIMSKTIILYLFQDFRVD